MLVLKLFFQVFQTILHHLICVLQCMLRVFRCMHRATQAQRFAFELQDRTLVCRILTRNLFKLRRKTLLRLVLQRFMQLFPMSRVVELIRHREHTSL